jgi:hypothetical protein
MKGTHNKECTQITRREGVEVKPHTFQTESTVSFTLSSLYHRYPLDGRAGMGMKLTKEKKITAPAGDHTLVVQLVALLYQQWRILV